LGNFRRHILGFQNHRIAEPSKLRNSKGFMANTSTLSREERKKAKRVARKKRKAERPLKPRDYPRGSKKPKVKKLARGQAKR
jgi:hypothetical protein